MRKIELLLQYILLRSYYGDMTDDLGSGHYNALNDERNSMTYETQKARIKAEIRKIGPVEEVDEIITIEKLEEAEDAGDRSYWWNPGVSS